MKEWKELEKLRILIKDDYDCCDTIAQQNKDLGKLEILDLVIPIVRSLEIDNDVLRKCNQKIKNRSEEIIDGMLQY